MVGGLNTLTHTDKPESLQPLVWREWLCCSQCASSLWSHHAFIFQRRNKLTGEKTLSFLQSSTERVTLPCQTCKSKCDIFHRDLKTNDIGSTTKEAISNIITWPNGEIQSVLLVRTSVEHWWRATRKTLHLVSSQVSHWMCRTMKILHPCKHTLTYIVQ